MGSELFDSQTDSDFDPFASTGKVRQRRSKPRASCVHSAYAMLSEVPSPVPDDWPRHPFKGYALPPQQIMAQERVTHALRLRDQDAIDEGSKVKGLGPSNFTTQYAIDWGRKQGWKLLQREGYNFRTKRHADLALGSDAMFESPRGIIFVQGAGKGERTKHRERFDARGGVERGERLRAGFVYVEFVRESKEPITREWWIRID